MSDLFEMAEIEDCGPLPADALPPLDEEGAHYIIRRATAIQAEITRVAEQAKALTAQLESDLASFLRWENRAERLEAWAAGELHGKRRSVTTIFGTVGFTGVGAKCVVTDEAAAMPWLKANAPEAVVEKIATAKLPKPVEATDEHGATIYTAPGPGMDALPARDQFTLNRKHLKLTASASAEENGDAS